MAQAPDNTPFLGMGRPTFDRASFEAEGLPQSLIDALMHIQGFMAACGYAGAAEAGQTEYQNVVARFDDPDWVLYGARPDTPLTPDIIPGLAGSGEITVERNNTLILAAATSLNFSTNFSVADAGGGQVDVDVTGGGGGTTYTASTPIVISGGNDISIQIGFGLNESAGEIVADIGDGLEADTNKFRVKAHTYIDVTSDGVAVDLTVIDLHSPTGDQYLRNNAGAFQWATLPPDADTTYTGGAGIDLDSTELRADPYAVSHLDFVDPLTGAASTIDTPSAQLAIKWNDIENFELVNGVLGHYNTDSWPPGVSYQSVPTWLKTLQDYSPSEKLVIASDPEADDTEFDQKVKWVPSPQKVIWGINPEGGHTITVVGTTLTFTLKAIKYTFDATNFVSAVEEDVEIVYSDGVECE